MIRIALAASLFAVMSLAASAAVEIKEVRSPDGFKAWLVEEPSIPFTALEIRFKGGSVLDRPGKRGAIHLMAGLIEEGAADLDATEFTAALESLAASFEFDTYDDSFSISARFLTENRDEAIDLLRKAITEPRFEESAVDRVRSQVLSIIASDEKDTSKIAGASFEALAFDGHPYATKKEGTAEIVSALTRDDVVNAWKDVFARDRVYVGAVGDITPEELGAIMDQLFAGLPGEGSPMPATAEYQLTGGVTVIDFPTPQSVAVFGHEGITRHDPDFFPAYVLNHIVGGGGFGSRLMDEVREKRGLTYGIGSYLLPMDYGALYLGQVQSQNERIAEAIDVIRDQWRQIAEGGVTKDELENAKTYLTGAYPLRFDGNAPIARILVGMQLDDLPIDYVETRNDKVEAVSLEDIQRVAARLLKPDELHFVVVGQPEGLETN